MHTPARTSQCRSRQTQHGLGVCTWMHLVNGTGNGPSPGQPTPGVVKQDESSRGSVDTTKTRSGPQRVRMSSGERPIGAAKGKQSDTEALCQPPPPFPQAGHMIQVMQMQGNAGASVLAHPSSPLPCIPLPLPRMYSNGWPRLGGPPPPTGPKSGQGLVATVTYPGWGGGGHGGHGHCHGDVMNRLPTSRTVAETYNLSDNHPHMPRSALGNALNNMQPHGGLAQRPKKVCT